MFTKMHKITNLKENKKVHKSEQIILTILILVCQEFELKSILDLYPFSLDKKLTE